MDLIKLFYIICKVHIKNVLSAFRDADKDKIQ